MSPTATKKGGPKVLITGGGGYLGYHTALVLKAAGETYAVVEQIVEVEELFCDQNEHCKKFYGGYLLTDNLLFQSKQKTGMFH